MPDLLDTIRTMISSETHDLAQLERADGDLTELRRHLTTLRRHADSVRAA